MNKETVISEWIEVCSKKHSKKINIEKSNKVNINYTYNDLISKINSIIQKQSFNVIAVYLYGSRARQTNRKDSDIDIIIFFKTLYSNEEFKFLQEILEKELTLPVDLVCCIFKNKWIEHLDYRDKCYFEQVLLDAKIIYNIDSKKYNLEDLINMSIKIHYLAK